MEAPVNDILVSAAEIVLNKTRAGGSLSLCHIFLLHHMLYTVDAGCKRTLVIGEYAPTPGIKYTVNLRTVFQKMVHISGMLS